MAAENAQKVYHKRPVLVGVVERQAPKRKGNRMAWVRISVHYRIGKNNIIAKKLLYYYYFRNSFILLY